MLKRIIFISASVCLFAACGQDKTNRLPADLVKISATADSGQASAPQNAPEITFTENSHDFGRIKDGEKVEYSFKFQNTGKGDLLIVNATASCGCTVPEYPKELIKPGETGFIKVKFDSKGKAGHVDKTVSIICNTEPRETMLTITGEVYE